MISITPEKDLKGSTRLVREALRGVELTDGEALFSLPLGVPSRVTSGSKTDVWPSKLKQFVNIARYSGIGRFQNIKIAKVFDFLFDKQNKPFLLSNYVV